MLPPVSRLALAALAALLLGCGAAASTPLATVVVAAPPPEPVVPFVGTYPKHALATFQNGERITVFNRDSQASLRLTSDTATFDQRYTVQGVPRHIVQVYRFGPGDVKPVDGGYDIKLTFESLEGEHYSPDKGSPTLVARRRASGFQIALMTRDTKGVLGVVLFGAARPADPEREMLSLAAHAGFLPAEVASLTAPSDLAAPPPDAAITPSGLASKVLAAGPGQTHPGPTDTVKVRYTGWTKDGLMFDSSALRGDASTLKLDKVIAGFTEGLSLMVQGEKRRLWIPSRLAYGATFRRDAPTGDLVYDVELLDVIPAIPPPPVPEDVGKPPRTARRTRSGLAYRVLQKGTGKRSPKATDKVTVSYTGWTTDGKMFDSSVTRGTPATFRLTSLIKGWTEGLQLMKEGEKTRFWIPAKLAYGDRPTRPGAPAGMLVFDIELHAIE
jgi:FKBP-type peptidyl-prolyl cis-trans isomerase